MAAATTEKDGLHAVPDEHGALVELAVG